MFIWIGLLLINKQNEMVLPKLITAYLSEVFSSIMQERVGKVAKLQF